MKPIIKYISLLLFSGLILPFYASITTKKVVKPATAIGKVAVNNHIVIKTGQAPYSVYQFITEIFFPEFKN